MDGYTDTQMIVVKQIQAERRAAAVADRVAADCRRAHAAPGRAGQSGRWLGRLTAPFGAATPVARP